MRSTPTALHLIRTQGRAQAQNTTGAAATAARSHPLRALRGACPLRPPPASHLPSCPPIPTR